MIKLQCDRLTLKRTDSEKIVAGSFGFVRFSYTCDESWAGYSVSAQFHRLGDDKAYHVAAILPEKEYAVPAEVLVSGGIFTVCLFGVKGEYSRASSNVVTVEVCEDGLVNHTLPTPTPDIFNQYVQAVLASAAQAAQAAASARDASDAAEKSEAYIRSILIEEEFAAQVADWNASFATDVLRAREAVENQRASAVSELIRVGDEALAALDEVHSSCETSYREQHENAMREFSRDADAKWAALGATFAHLAVAAGQVEKFEGRLSALEKTDVPASLQSFHVFKGEVGDLPDAMEWFLAHPLGDGRYSQSDYSEPIFLLSSQNTWQGYTVVYSYAEPDEENYTETAAWTELKMAKISDLPRASTAYGTKIDEHNYLEIFPATESAIKIGTHKFQPIVPYYLGYGVGTHGIARLSVMPTAAGKYIDWVVLYTGESDGVYEKNGLYTCINDGGYKWVKYTLSQMGDIESALDSILVIQNTLLGGNT